MNPTTDRTKRTVTINKLTQRGFRVEFVHPDFALLSKPRTNASVHIVTVDNDGYSETTTLGEFLCKVLNYQ